MTSAPRSPTNLHYHGGILLEQWRRHDDSISFDLVKGSVRTQQSKKAA